MSWLGLLSPKYLEEQRKRAELDAVLSAINPPPPLGPWAKAPRILGRALMLPGLMFLFSVMGSRSRPPLDVSPYFRWGAVASIAIGIVLVALSYWLQHRKPRRIDPSDMGSH